jgi:TolA-binding protein
MKLHFSFSRASSRRWVSLSLGCALALGTLGGAAASSRADTPDEQWTFASGLYTQKLWGLAAENLSKFLKANPKHPKAALASYQLAAAILRDEKNGKVNYAAGAAAYEAALRDHPDDKLAAPAYFELADALFNLNQFERAAGFYKKFLALKPSPEQGAEAAYMQGESWYALKKFALARSAYALVASNYPKSRPAPYALLALGTLAEEGGQLAQAETNYQKVWTGFPTSDVALEARLRGANVSLTLKKWAEATRGFEAVLASPDAAKWKSTALAGLADAHWGRKNWSEAASAYERALQEAEGDSAADQAARASMKMRLADSFFNAKQWERAASTYAGLTSAADAVTAANALYFRGRALSDAGKTAEAEADLKALLARFPTHEKAPRAALLLADARAQAKDAGAAATAYRAVIDKYPKSPEAKMAQASLLDLANGLAAGAARSTGDAAGNDAKVGGASTPGAAASTSAGAGGDLEKVLRALPPGAAAGNAQARLAQAAYGRGEWGRAAELARGALASKPDATTQRGALYLLASAELNAGKAAESAASFARLVALNPAPDLAASARLGQAWALLDLKKWDAASTAARAGLAALAAAPKPTAAKAKENADVKARLSLALGESLWRAKKFAPAAAALSAATGAADKEVAAQSAFYAASSFESLGKWKEAGTQWNLYATAAEPGERARAHLKRGLALLKAKDSAGAQAAFDRAASLDAGGEIGARALYESAWAATEAKSSGAGARWARLASEFPDSKYAATAHFQNAENLFEAKKWSEAATAYRSLVENPKWAASEEVPQAWYQLGSSLFNLKQWSEAAKAFERAATFGKSEFALESAFWAGESWAKSGDARASQAQYEAFLSQAALSSSRTAPAPPWKRFIPTARLGLGRALLDNGNAARAETVLREGLQGLPAASNAAPELNFRLAQALEAQSKWKDAATQALKVATLFPASEWAPQGAWIAAQATEKGGDKAAAQTLYRAIAQAQPPGEFASQAAAKLQELGGN